MKQTYKLLVFTCTAMPTEPCKMGGSYGSNTLIYGDSTDFIPGLADSFHSDKAILAPSYLDVNLVHYHAEPPHTEVQFHNISSQASQLTEIKLQKDLL